MPDDIEIKDANDATATVATKDIAGREFQQMLVSDPADGAAIKPASQNDVQAVRDRLPAAGAAAEATLAALLAKVIATPSTEAKQDAIITALGQLLTELGAKTEPSDTQAVSAAALPLPAGASTEATAAAILAKLIPAPSTEAKQDAAKAVLDAIAALLAREALNNDSEDPATESGLPTEAYGMVYDEIRNRWHRQRGDIARGTKVYTDELLAALEVLNQTLAAMASAMPQPDAFKRLRIALETVSATNMSINAAQWGGQAAASGAGAAGNGAPRVTPSNDTLAGSPQLFMLYQSMLAPGMTAFYDRATY